MRFPCFITGIPKSGTTVLLELMSSHPGFAWISQFQNARPKRLWVSRYNRIYDWPVIGDGLFCQHHKPKRGFLPRPVEPWTFWTHYLGNFRWERHGPEPPQPYLETHPEPSDKETVRQVVTRICDYQGKGRFLSKYTEFPRYDYMTGVFPDARFIRIEREPHATIFSYYRRIRSGQFTTWAERDWWMKGWPEEWRDWWGNEFEATKLALAVVQWCFMETRFREARDDLRDDQLQAVQYSALIESPGSVLASLFEFCGLSYPPRTSRFLSQFELENRNSEWKKTLSDQQKETIDSIMSRLL